MLSGKVTSLGHRCDKHGDIDERIFEITTNVGLSRKGCIKCLEEFINENISRVKEKDENADDKR